MKPASALPRIAFVLAGLVMLVATGSARAGAFAVSPVRLELGSDARSGAITVRNDDEVPLAFQVRGVRWTQDEAGQEVYEDASDLVYFPRIVTIDPGKEAVIRVGTPGAGGPVERTYRLFIEELASTAGPQAAGAQVRFLVRFGAPIFVAPERAVQQLELRDAALTAAGEARWTLHNAGNGHERIESLAVRGFDAQGQEVFVHRPEDRYLLASQTRHFALRLDPGQCARLARLDLEIKTSSTEIRRPVHVGPTPCR